MRRGEAAALRWSDISFESREVIVDESVIGAQGTLIVKSPKTSGLLRTVAIDEGVERALEGLRVSQLAVVVNCGFTLVIPKLKLDTHSVPNKSCHSSVDSVLGNSRLICHPSDHSFSCTAPAASANARSADSTACRSTKGRRSRIVASSERRF